MRRVLVPALLVCAPACEDKSPPRTASAPPAPATASTPPPAKPESSAPAPAPASAPASTAAEAHRDASWPCSEEFVTDGEVTQKFRFGYGHSPEKCFVPPEILSAGCATEVQELDASGTLRRTRVFTYDAQGNLSALAYQRDDGKVTTRLAFLYTGGVIDKMEVHDGSDGSLLGGNRYKKSGDTITREQFDESGAVKRKASYHYQHNRLTSAEVDHAGLDGASTVKIRLSYEGDRLTREETTAGGKVLGASTYGYDCP